MTGASSLCGAGFVVRRTGHLLFGDDGQIDRRQRTLDRKPVGVFGTNFFSGFGANRTGNSTERGL